MKAKMIVGMVGLLIAVGVLGLVAWQKHKRDVARTWPTVQATITRAEVESTGSQMRNNRQPTNTIVISSGDSATRSHQKRVSTWRIAVHYEYTVGGGHYTGRSGDLGRQTTDRGEAERELARFPAGAALTVHYNPQDPSESMALE